MDESEENMSAEDIRVVDSPMSVKFKPKKRSLVERELETNLTARVTSPVTSEGTSTSRYGRARKLKTGLDIDLEKVMQPLKIDVSKTQPQAYKMHASNSPIRKESPKRAVTVVSSIEDQIENIYNENIALSRFSMEEKVQSPAKKYSKVYIRKDLIQKPDTDTVVLIKNMFSPNKPNTHLNNILERSSDKYSLNGHGKSWNGFPDTSSVVKTLDFDGKKKKNEDDCKIKKTLSKSELFELEASCEYQVGDLAWARVGTYPFWPCIVTREPFSDMFVKKKLFGRVERAVIHVTFLGDNGRRGWIVDNMLRQYHGKAEFESAREKFTPEAKKKDPRLYAAHFVSEKKLALWNVSVDEAETLMKEPKRLRIDALYDLLEKSRASKTTPKRETGGKITRTDSDVSLSESLYDTLFSEDDGKTDDAGRTKRARNKSLDMSEVVTACLDNMAAKSGIIQLQRQSHMDRWLQKAKSKTPEKMQPKLQIKIKKDKRKDKVKKESKKSRVLRKNESLSSDTNLLPFQNEHDYSSVNYENHNINDSSNTSNKNTDSASGLDSTLDTSGIDVIVKVESLSSSMEDCSQDDIITTVVNDDIVITEPENMNKEVNSHNESANTDNTNDTIENNNEYNLETSNVDENDEKDIPLETPINKSNMNNSVKPRRSKRKRQTFERLNNSLAGNKIKEPKLNLAEEKTESDTSNSRLTKQNSSEDKYFEGTKTEVDQKKPATAKLEIETSNQNKLKELMGFDSNFKPIVVIEPLKIDGLVPKAILKKSKLLVREKLLDSVNKNYVNAKNNLESPIISSNVNQKETSITKKTGNDESQQANTNYCVKQEELTPDVALNGLSPFIDNDSEQQDTVSKGDHQKVTECSIDSGKMEIDNSNDKSIGCTVNEIKPSNLSPQALTSATENGILPLETDLGNTVVDINLTSMRGIGESQSENSVPIVVIGEETYMFDRTLSQDYDEINADQCDEINNLPINSSNETVDDTRLSVNKTRGNEKTLTQDETSGHNMETPELMSSSTDDYLYTKDNCGTLNKPSNDMNISNASDSSNANESHRECETSSVGDSSDISNEKPKDGNSSDQSFTEIKIDNDAKIATSEVQQLSLVQNVEISTKNLVQEQVTEENSPQCIFLGKPVELPDAQFNDINEGKSKKDKPLRFTLKRNRINSLNMNKNCYDIQKSNTETVHNDLKNINHESDQDIKSVNSPTTKRKARSKDQPDMYLSDPEFLKYLEIRQDALIDEHPDLTRDEIVTYLYQNWLYHDLNKSDVKKTEDAEQYAVKGLNQEPAPKVKKIKLIRKKPKVEKPDSMNEDIRSMMQKMKPNINPHEVEASKESLKNNVNEPNSCKDDHGEVCSENIGKPSHDSKDDTQTKLESKSTEIESTDRTEKSEPDTEESKSLKDYNITDPPKVSDESFEINWVPRGDSAKKKEEETFPNANYEPSTSPTSENNDVNLAKSCSDDSATDLDSEYNTKKTNEVQNSSGSEILDTPDADLGEAKKDSKESVPSRMNGIIENNDIPSETKTNAEFDAETASIKSEDSVVSTSKRKGRSKEKQDMKNAMGDPEFIKYLEARQDALIEEQPDLTQEEIVTYLYQTWFYEESNKSDMKKTDETEQSNLVKGLNQEPAPQPRKYRKKHKVEKDPGLKNVDIRSMIQKEKPKRKATQSKPYYNEDDSDLEEEDLETFKIFDREEQNEGGEEIDEVELYFEQLTKPKPNVFKGYVRERVCEICEKIGNLVKCKSCHGTFHVDCGKKEVEVIEVAAPTRGRKKKRGRKPKGYDPLLDSESQSDERSQDANNSEEINVSIEDETEPYLIIDAENFESQWEVKMKELQTGNQEDFVSDQEINWELEPGHCEIVDVKQKEKPIDYSDYKCNNCLKYDTPICFVCKLNKSPKSQMEVRQKCHVAHCHRYYHLECLDHWPQTQFHSWEPSKTNKREIEYIEALTCPRHVCHTCVSDDPRGCKTRFSGDKLARCVKCPATYHSYTKCLPAGSQILTGSQIICPRHYEHRTGKVPCHVNTGWCFICALGGTLICCEYCPTSFHAECLNIKPPEGSYMCEDCETGRLPLYGEMVWVKLGHYRWWPGIVLHPTQIPDNILAVKHSPGEFVVRFFGQYDHYWVNRGRVFPFQEGDSGKISSQKSKIDAAFTTAMEHAQRACEILKKMEPNEEEDMDIASSLLPPHYVKLKTNKPVGGVARRDADANSLTQCDCDPTQPDPCGPYSHCLNRMLLTECGPLCRAGERCNNRAFERRLYPRLAAYRTPMRGWGLRALQDIKQGQFVIEYVGELIDMEEFRRRMCRKHEIRDENFYFLTLDKERMIDAGPKGNLARFMNHCCEPNCETQKWTVLGDVRVGLFALRDIPANSEVTFNYNLECAGIEKKRCLCGAQRCSGYIGAKPKQLQDDQAKKLKPPAKRTYKKRKPVEDSPSTSKKVPKIKIKPIKPRELTEIEKDLLIIKNATNGMSSDSEGSRLSSVDEKNPKALKRKRVSFSSEEVSGSGKKVKLTEEEIMVE